MQVSSKGVGTSPKGGAFLAVKAWAGLQPNYSWPSAEIAVMGAAGACNILPRVAEFVTSKPPPPQENSPERSRASPPWESIILAESA